jgi:hydroxymethylglutaryl-CoA lyase/(R)-citramalyl-CoA lyase
MSITICDVGPRDGLQNEPETLAPSFRAELINRLAAARLPRIEAASFVRADAVPQMAGAEEVVAAIKRRDGTEYSGLALNEKGYERLAASGLDRVNFTLAATESFSKRNANQSLAEAQAAAQSVIARSELPVTLTISVAFGCPFEGHVDPGIVAKIAARFPTTEIVLADTIGVATPKQVRALVERTSAPGVHLHNTRNTGYANAVAALESGATLFDASCGGLGGCPYAPRATGNIATEDLVYLFEGEGVGTGVDLDALVLTSQWLETALGRTLEGQVYRAGAWAGD